MYPHAAVPGVPVFIIQSTVVNDGVYNAFPWCVNTAAATWLAVYRKGASHTSVDGVVTLRKSTNGGRTWGAESAVASPAGGHDYRDPSITRTGTGKLIINFWDSPGPGQAVGIYTINSTDGGTVWSGLSSIITPYTKATLLGATTGDAVRQHSSGILVMQVYGQNTGDTADRMGVIRSSDDGASWGSLINISAQNGNYNEATSVELADGTIQLYVRQETNPGPIYRTTSNDSGATWGAFTSLGWNVVPGRPTALRFPVTGVIRLFYRSLTGTAVYRDSFDNGSTWGSQQIYSGTSQMYAGGNESLTADEVAVVTALESSGTNCQVLFGLMTAT